MDKNNPNDIKYEIAKDSCIPVEEGNMVNKPPDKPEKSASQLVAIWLKMIYMTKEQIENK